MRVSGKILTWVMRLYPPLLFQRIWVCRIGKEFTTAKVKIHRSIFNRNYNGSIFGGTIFAAADPFYALLFDQLFQRKGYRTIVWLKSATIQYLKPGRSALFFEIIIEADDIREAEEALSETGKFIKTYPITIVDRKGQPCAIMHNEVYIKVVGRNNT